VRRGGRGVAFRIRSAVQYRPAAELVTLAAAIMLWVVRPDGGTTAGAGVVEAAVTIAVATAQATIQPYARALSGRGPHDEKPDPVDM